MTEPDPVKAASTQEKAELAIEQVEELCDELLKAGEIGTEDEFYNDAELLAQDPHLAKFVILELANRVLDERA